MESMIDLIFRRHSTRAYDGRDVENEKKDSLMDYLKSFEKGPFGNTVRFRLVGQGEGNNLGTSLMIKGAVSYLAGAVKKGEMSMEDFGYCMEAGVLKATGLGLGSCWIAGTLSRSAFAKRIGLMPGEVIPAVTPLGYPGDKSSFIVGIFGSSKGARNRKSFEELFFDRSFDNPLLKKDAGQYGTVLEAVRAAPSASNRQPWRIIREKPESLGFHFYLNENVMYNNIFRDIKLQNIDMGIAICHFEFAAWELGLKGAFSRKKPGIDTGDLKYIASWTGE